MVIALVAIVASAGSQWAAAGGDQPLAGANSRWRGARCRSRQEISFKGSPDRQGSVNSRWLWWGEEHSNHRARFVFEHAGDLPRQFHKGVIPPGTEFTALGWREERPGGSLFLEVQVAGTPVTGKLYYLDDWVGKVGVGRVDDFERWVRFEVFEILDTPDEALVDVVREAAVAPAPAVAHTVADQTPQRADATPLACRVLAVSVEPTRVAPGDEVQLVVVYGVEGVPPGLSLEVTERRTIVKNGERLNTVEELVHRNAGVHRSSQSMRLPGGLAAGVYELEVTILSLDTESQGSAVFEVTHAPP